MRNLNRPVLARGSICYSHALFTPTAFKCHTGDLSVDCLLSLCSDKGFNK